MTCDVRSVCRIVGGCAIAFVALSIAVAVHAVDDADLVRRQSDQRQVRVMAQQLVSSVLDLQLRQLEENRLTDLPIYSDIQLMRGNLSELVDREMAAVIEQLAAAQALEDSERDAKFVEVRLRDSRRRHSTEYRASDADAAAEGSRDSRTGTSSS